MNIYDFNKKINGINNLNEGEYAKNILNSIEQNIINKVNMDLNDNSLCKSMYKEIKF